MGKTLCSQRRGPGSIPGQGTRSRMRAATKSPHAAMKIPHTATMTRSSLNKLINIKKKEKEKQYNSCNGSVFCGYRIWT